MRRHAVNHPPVRSAPWHRWMGLAAVLALVPLGCDLEVVDPDIVTPDNLAGASSLPTIRAAAIGDFALAYSGSGADGSSGTEGQIMASGLLADEWVNSETFPTRIEIDRRSIQVTNGTTTGWFRTLSRARRSAEFAAARYRSLAPDTTREPGLAEVLSLAGFTYLFFAEHYCSGVPFSQAQEDGSLVFGTPLTTTQMLDTALDRFTEALAVATALDTSTAAARTARNNVLNLARIGLGRTLVDQAQFAAASAAVTLVPTSFVYTIGHSVNSVRQNNGVFVANVIAERYSVANLEGTNGLPFRTQADGRVPSIRTPATDVGFDATTPQFDQLRFTDRNVSIPLATGAEARLIEAEAFMRAGDNTNYLARHNALRAAPPGYFAAPGTTIAPLAALTTTGLTTAQVEDQHFRERGYWLWLSAHRLGDLRRMARAPYGRGTETVFPTGNYFKGGVYGPDVNFPVPFDETNNPNFVQCIDRNP